ncbi:MAG: hypothetical protein ACWGNV_08775 [Bacteroidales bacterium]
MPEKESNSPLKFWQELKRRNVFRVLLMYAGTLNKFKAARELWLTYLIDIDELIQEAEEGLANNS